MMICVLSHVTPWERTIVILPVIQYSAKFLF